MIALFLEMLQSCGATTLKDLLQQYASCSGQLINFKKSSVVFSIKVADGNRSDVGCILRVHVSNNIEKYLGLPAIIGRHKRQAFARLQDRFRCRILSWIAQTLSMRAERCL